MRREILLAAVILAGCRQPLPAGVERVAGGSDAQAFDWSQTSGRLAYVEGRFPDRTYLVVQGRGVRTRARRRLKGFALGERVALSRDGRRVLLEAGKIGRFASRSEPVDRVVLVVDADSGRILSEHSIGLAGVVALSHPAWSQDPIAVWNSQEGVSWKAYGKGASSPYGSVGGVLRGPAAWRALLLDEPYLIVSEKQTSRPRLAAYDLRRNRLAAEWLVALTASPLALRPDGTALSARWMPETGRFVLESGNPKTGRRAALLEAEGEIESAVETERGLYAIAKDPTRRNATGKDFLAPRVLLVVENGGQRWRTPWTSHRGRFLGADPADGRLLFAVTDRDEPAAWTIAPTRSALAAAGLAIDEKAK